MNDDPYKQYEESRQGNYNNVQQGYAEMLAANQQNYVNILSNYNTLYANVINGLSGSNAATNQQIEDDYAKNAGAMQQSLISRGLGNSTVQDAMSRGLQYDRSKARVAADNQYAGTIAGYQSNLGLAGLSAAQQFAESQNRLGVNMWGQLGQIGQGPSFGELANYQLGLAHLAQAQQGPRVTSNWPDYHSGGGGGGRSGGGYGGGGGSYGGGGGYYGGGGYAMDPGYASAAPMDTSYGGGGDWGSPYGTYGGEGLGDYGGAVPSYSEPSYGGADEYGYA